MGNKKTIIYAEDDESINRISLRFFERMLSEYNIESYLNGTTLENRLKGNKKNIVAVITDNQMPGIEGSKIIKEYAQNPNYSHIPFILVYGGEDEIGKKAVENGAYSFIKKPITDWKDYCEKIKKAIINSKK